MEHPRAHDAAGFDLALVGYSASSAYHAALHTERLDFLVAHRRVRGAEARKIATFDQLTGGRLAVHIITGKTDAEHQGDGDFSPKVETLSQGRRISRGDAARLVERASIRFCRRDLPVQASTKYEMVINLANNP